MIRTLCRSKKIAIKIRNISLLYFLTLRPSPYRYLKVQRIVKVCNTNHSNQTLVARFMLCWSQEFLQFKFLFYFKSKSYIVILNFFCIITFVFVARWLWDQLLLRYRLYRFAARCLHALPTHTPVCWLWPLLSSTAATLQPD